MTWCIVNFSHFIGCNSDELQILDFSVYTCLTQLYGGRDMYNLLPTQVKCSCLLSFSFINLKVANEKGRNM